MDHILFQSWSRLERVAIVGGAANLPLLLMLRVSGKRSLAKLYVFDLVVTVALGSTLATTLLSKTVALAEGRACPVSAALISVRTTTTGGAPG